MKLHQLEKETYDVETTKDGYKFIGMSQADANAVFQGYGRCDMCGHLRNYGYLMPALGQKWICANCRVMWEANTHRYPMKDREYQEKAILGFQQTIQEYREYTEAMRIKMYENPENY